MKVEQADKKIDHIHKSLEFQIGQLANAFNGRRPGELPSKTEINSREHINAITLRSGRTLEDNNLGKIGKSHENEENMEKEEANEHIAIDIDMPSSHISHKNVTNSIPFPDRLKKSNKEKEFEKIAQILK